MNDIECPYCKSREPIPYAAISNAEVYGSKTVNVCCVICGQALRVKLRRTVICADITMADFKVDDWGNESKCGL
jgi:hypothetical protein